MRRAVSALLAALLLTASPPTRADDAAAGASTPALPRVPVGFSKLLLRLDGTDVIGFVTQDQPVRLIERMRSAGFDAVGAENLLFGKDESRRARFVIGGTVREAECATKRLTLSCRIGVEWQVLDVESDQVAYIMMARSSVIDLPQREKERMAGRLLDQALDRLLQRPRFLELLAHREEQDRAPAPAPFAMTTLPRCAAGKKVPEDAEDLLRNVVVLKSQNGFGSGFIVSPEGLVLTAAHVVDAPTLKVRLRDGTENEAVPVRVSRGEDVALMRLVHPLTAHSCMPLRVDAPPSGTEVYAVGVPASLDLAFSLTRGIVSGYPSIEGRRRLQTDAPVNPGNSGGPISDTTGSALGVVSFKLVANRVEGLAFAVPIPETLAALGLHVGDGTGATLMTETATLAPPSATDVIHDSPDKVPSLDPDGDRRREEERVAREKARVERENRLAAEEREEARERAEAEDRSRRTPAIVPYLRWIGLGAALVGAGGAVLTYTRVSDTTTHGEFDTLRAWNVVAWTGAVLGTGAFVTSFFIPLEPPTEAPVVIGLLPGGLAVHGRF